jgi:hypothetical protein
LSQWDRGRYASAIGLYGRHRYYHTVGDQAGRHSLPNAVDATFRARHPAPVFRSTARERKEGNHGRRMLAFGRIDHQDRIEGRAYTRANA